MLYLLKETRLASNERAEPCQHLTKQIQRNDEVLSDNVLGLDGCVYT